MTEVINGRNSELRVHKKVLSIFENVNHEGMAQIIERTEHILTAIYVFEQIAEKPPQKHEVLWLMIARVLAYGLPELINYCLELPEILSPLIQQHRKLIDAMFELSYWKVDAGFENDFVHSGLKWDIYTNSRRARAIPLTRETALCLCNASERDFALRALNVGCEVYYSIPVGNSLIDFYVVNPKRKEEDGGIIVEVTELLKEDLQAGTTTCVSSRTAQRKKRQIEAMVATGRKYVVLFGENLIRMLCAQPTVPIASFPKHQPDCVKTAAKN